MEILNFLNFYQNSIDNYYIIKNITKNVLFKYFDEQNYFWFFLNANDLNLNFYLYSNNFKDMYFNNYQFNNYKNAGKGFEVSITNNFNNFIVIFIIKILIFPFVNLKVSQTHLDNFLIVYNFINLFQEF